MKKRLFSGSLLGLKRSVLHRADTNPFIRIFLEEPVDRERLKKALLLSLSDCPYMRYTVTEDEGIFLSLSENDSPLPLLREEPYEINTAENNGHSAAVCCKDNFIGVYVTHSLTDGAGIFTFTRTLLDRYFGEKEGIFKGAGEADYDRDPLETQRSVSEKYKGAFDPGKNILTLPDKETRGISDTSLFRASYTAFKTLCKDLDASVQTVLTLLCLKALSILYPDDDRTVSARIPVNARKLFNIPNSFQNASLANMRVFIGSKELKSADDSELLRLIGEQCMAQNTQDEVSFQYNEWRKVLFAGSREERMKRIVPLAGQDTIMISHLGKGLAGDTYAGRIKAPMAAALLFPLMVYSMVVGDRIFFFIHEAGSLSENQFTQSARPHFAGESDTNLGHVARYAPQIRSVPPQTGDAHLGQSVFGQSPGGNREFGSTLKTVLERRGIDIAEFDPATGKAV